jgi:hypothetical protein
MPRDRKTLLCASAAIVGAAVLACAAVVGRYHQQKTELEQFLLVPMNGPMLFSHPGGELLAQENLVSFEAAQRRLLPGCMQGLLPGCMRPACTLAGGIRWRLVRAGGACSQPAGVLAGATPQHATYESRGERIEYREALRASYASRHSA